MRARAFLLIPLLLLTTACAVGQKAAQGPGSTTLKEGIQHLPAATIHLQKGVLGNFGLSDASFVNSKDGWAVGAYGTSPNPPFHIGFVARTRDGGASWNVVARLPGKILTSVSFQNADDGWAVGGAPQNSGPTAASRNLILTTTDGGKTWKEVLSAPGDVEALAFPTATSVWAAVSGPCSGTSCTGQILSSPDGGQTWTPLLKTTGPVLGVFVEGSTGWADTIVPNGKSLTAEVLGTSDGGATWTPLAQLPAGNSMGGLTTASQFESQMAFNSPKAGWLTLFSRDTCSMGGCGLSSLFRTTDGGHTWTIEKRLVRACTFQQGLATLGQDVAVSQSVNLAACPGPGATIAISSDGGNTFQPSPAFGAGSAVNLGFIPGGGLWVAGPGVLATEKSLGSPWTQSFPALAPEGSIAFLTPSLGFGGQDALSLGAVLKTADGGKTWTLMSSFPGFQVLSLSFVSPQSGFLALAPRQGQQAPSEIMRTTNGGKSWTVSYRAPSGETVFPSIRFFNSSKGLFVNEEANCLGSCPTLEFQTQDGGLVWRAVPATRPPASIISVAIPGETRLFATTLASAISQGAIFDSADGGHTWTKVLPIPKSLNGGPDLAFLSDTQGFMVTSDVKVMSSNGKAQVALLAILATENGGKSWTLRDLPGIQDDWTAQIDFLNAQDGWLLAPPGLWKTTDGGASWSQIP